MNWVDRLFLVCAVIGGFLFAVRLVLFFVGGVDADTDMDVDAHVDFGGADVGHDLDVGHDFDVDHDFDAHGVHESDVSFRLLSFQGLTAFFMMFELVGLAMHRGSLMSAPVSLAAALAAGVAAMALIAWFFGLMKSLQHSGTLRLANAVGSKGTVYLTIPSEGTGKVNVLVQGRLATLEAITHSESELKTGQQVRVVQVTDDDLLVVEPE